MNVLEAQPTEGYQLIQFILIPMLAAMVLLYCLRFRSRLLDRLVVLFLGIVGAIMVAMPQWTSTLSRSVGVGRGVDLINYLSLFALAFICLLLYSKLRDVEHRLSEIARAHAIAHAQWGKRSAADGNRT